MKILHLSFHKGCVNDFNYVCNKLDYKCEVLSSFKEICTSQKPIYETNGQHYNMTHNKANRYWHIYKDYFNTFDCIITSDTAPLSRIFLQNNWKKPLVIWICNRFDYKCGRSGGFPDKEYYDLIKKATVQPNVHLIGYTAFENFYCRLRGIDIGTKVITPCGGISQTYDNFVEKKHLNDIFLVPPYHNDTKMMNLSQHLTRMGIKNFNGRYNGPLDLTNYKGVIHIPYAWSNLAFFEAWLLGIIYFIPSIYLLKKFRRNFFWSPPFIPQVLSISEWYNPKHKDLLIYFDSWKDLKTKINALNYEKHKLKLKEYGEKHKIKTLNKWHALLRL